MINKVAENALKSFSYQLILDGMQKKRIYHNIEVDNDVGNIETSNGIK